MDETIKTRIDSLVQKSRVVLFMKGTRQFPQCGFSGAVVQMLNATGTPYETVNVLADNDVRQAIKDYSNWPTIPQLYVDGKFVGGCDIVREMSSTGELGKLLGGQASS